MASTSLTTFLLAVLLLAAASNAVTTCKTARTTLVPLELPIRNVSLRLDSSVKRGVFVTIGTPPQNFALDAASTLNNTIIHSDTCADSNITKSQCATFRGGLYSNTLSSTLHFADDQRAAGGSLEAPFVDDNNGTSWRTDIFNPISTISLPDFPLPPDPAPQFQHNLLGLGHNSTMLNALVDKDLIASRTWSLFNGLDGGDAASQMDGSLVLGGYDAAKVTGDNLTETLRIGDCESGLVVNVTDIVMNFPNGTNLSIIGGARFRLNTTCIIPESNGITVPTEVWQAFLLNSGGKFKGKGASLRASSQIFDANGVYPGALTISLSTRNVISPTFLNTKPISSTLNITIPNSQLVVPRVGTSSDGQPGLLDPSSRDIFIQEANATETPLLGFAFMTAAYLMVNHDDSTFSLWQNRPTNDKKLVRVDPARCGDSSTFQGSALGGQTPPSDVDAGTIAGAVVGGVAAIAILAAVVGLLRHRRKLARQRAAARDASPTGSDGMVDKSLGPQTSPAELQGHGLFSRIFARAELQQPAGPPPQELSAAREEDAESARPRTPPRELPADYAVELPGDSVRAPSRMPSRAVARKAVGRMLSRSSRG